MPGKITVKNSSISFISNEVPIGVRKSVGGGGVGGESQVAGA